MADASPSDPVRIRPTRKRSKAMLLMLTPDEDERVRSLAALSGKSLSDFVLACLDHVPRPAIDLSAVGMMSASIVALAEVPKSVRDLERNLAKCSQRLTQLFLEAPTVAAASRDEINALFTEIRTLLERIQPDIQNVQAAVHEPRLEMLRVMNMVSQELARAGHKDVGLVL